MRVACNSMTSFVMQSIDNYQKLTSNDVTVYDCEMIVDAVELKVNN